MMEIMIVLLLIVLNGVFAMAEIALISSRKSKLQQQANEGDLKAKEALLIASDPHRFLSTVQVGITLVGIFAGVFGGATIAENLAIQFETIPLIQPYSEAAALTIVVGVITYLSLIVGELVPKSIALTNPERIASWMAKPMNILSNLTHPLIAFLSFSTSLILAVLRIRPHSEPTISDEEIRLLIREGANTGVLEHTEMDIMERTLKLADKKVKSLMTSRKEVVWLDIDSSFKSIRNKITKNPHTHFPVCRDSLDKVIGIVRTDDLLRDFLANEKIDLKKSLQKPLFIPESMDALRVLETFKKLGLHMALVSDEYGNTGGVISLTDILEAVVGDIPTVNELSEEEIVKRDDGTFLVDGLVSIEEFKDFFNIKKLPGEKSGIYHTLGGFITSKLGKIPSVGDKLIHDVFKFEIVDMDGTRVDKILVEIVTESI